MKMKECKLYIKEIILFYGIAETALWDGEHDFNDKLVMFNSFISEKAEVLIFPNLSILVE